MLKIHLLSQEKVSFSQIIKLALPAIIAGIAEPLISLTDVAIIGNIEQHSVEVLAAAGIVGSFLSALIWILAQTKTAISATVSKFLGSGKLNDIKTLVPQTIALNFIVGIVIYIATTLVSNYIFSLYNAEGLLLTYAKKYYGIRALGYPLTLVTFAIFGVFRGLQNTYWAMLCSLTGAIINIVLDITLVFGIEDIIPAYGLTGAAWASVIAQIIMFCMAIVLYLKKTPFNFSIQFTIHPEMKPLLLMCGNLFLRTLSLNIAIAVANAYATNYGENTIAAQSILMNVWLFFSFFIDGFANAGNAISGKLLGEKAYHKLWNLSIDISKYAIIVAVILMLICAIFYTKIGVIFTQKEDVLTLFYSVFWVVLLMQPINAIAFMFDGIFKGLGEAKYLRNVLLVATFVGFIPTLLIADYFQLELYAIWIAFTVWMLIRSSALIIQFRKKYIIN